MARAYIGRFAVFIVWGLLLVQLAAWPIAIMAQPAAPASSVAAAPGVGAESKGATPATPAQPKSAAQPATAPATPENLSAAEIKSRIDGLSNNTELSAEQRKQARGYYQQALDSLQEAANYDDTLNGYQQALTEAPPKTARLEDELTKLQQQPSPPPPAAGASVDGVQSRLTAVQAQLSTLQGQLNGLDGQLTKLQGRPEKARAELADVQNKLGELQTQAPQPGATAPPPPVSAAAAVARTAKVQALQQKSAMLQQELASHDVRLALVRAQRALTAAQVARLNDRATKLQNWLNQKRRQQVSEAVEKAEQTSRSLADQPAVLRQAAATNSQLSKQLADLVHKTDSLGQVKQSVERKLSQLNEHYDSIQQQLQIGGLSDALSSVLRSERRQLPDVAKYRQGVEQRREQLVDARLQQFQVDQQRRQLSSLDDQVQTLLAQSPKPIPAARHKMVVAELRSLLSQRQQLLDQLSSNYSSYIQQLVALDQTQQQLVKQTTSYANLLDQKLFWIASSAPIGVSWLRNMPTAMAWLLMPSHWQEVVQRIYQSLWLAPVLVLATLLAWLLLMLMRSRLRRRLDEMSDAIGKVHRDKFLLTLEALLITVLLAIPWPLILLVWSDLLARPAAASTFAQAFGHGAHSLARFLLVGMVLYQLYRDNGVAPLHFRWSKQTCRVMRSALFWFIPVGAVSSLLVGMTEWHSNDLYRDTLGRLAFTVGSLAFALFLVKILRPRTGALGTLLVPGGVAWRLRFIWYPLVSSLPLLLAGLALTGYYYTALQLESRLFATGLLLLEILIGAYLFLRWLNIIHRRLALAQARARREAALAARASKEGGGPLPAEIQADIQEIEELDLAEVGEQTRALLKLAVTLAIGIGIWLIWSDLLPALTFLNQVTLWHQVITTAKGSQVTNITLGNLGLALLLLGVLMFFARNVPGLLEITVLQRLELDAGTRYAIVTISRYLITTIALFVALNIVGIGWQQAQWLVAALSVGLGFGLQEIFANFVSGLILLLERPVRVGDTITIGEKSGTVARIRIRATTLVNWDNMEMVIPNKTFITGELTNWTLSDQITRVIVPVGVSYGADPLTVHRVLLEVVQAHPLVLNEPAPRVLFLKFGDSSLNFEIWCYVRELGDRMTLVHDLHVRIHQSLRERGIEIPFPQRDLHIRTLPAVAEGNG